MIHVRSIGSTFVGMYGWRSSFENWDVNDVAAGEKNSHLETDETI